MYAGPLTGAFFMIVYPRGIPETAQMNQGQGD